MPPKVLKTRKRPWGKTPLDVEEDGLAVEDYISRLPKDCLLRVFGCLTRQELHKTKLLNKRLCSVAYSRSLYRGRSKPGCLSVQQVMDGYQFMLTTRDIDDRRNTGVKTFKYVYQHSKANPQGYREKRTLTHKHMHTGYIEHGRYGTPDDRPIASHFNDVLGALLIQYQAKMVVIAGVRLDAEFLSVISSSLKGSELQELSFNRVICDKNVIDAFDELQSLTRTSKVSKITVRNSPTLLEAGFLDEKWLAILGDAPNLKSVESWKDYYKHRFYPSKAILPIIAAYDTLKMPSMALNADWIGEFIMMHLNNRKVQLEKYVYWNISVDRGIIREEIQAQFNMATDFQCTLRKGLFTVMKKSSDLKAQFEVIPIVIDDGSTLFLLDICFSTVEVSERDACPRFRYLAYLKGKRDLDAFDSSKGKCWTGLPAPNSEKYWDRLHSLF